MKKLVVLLSVAVLSIKGYAQESTFGFGDDGLKNYRQQSIEGLNVFEPAKDMTSTSNQPRVKIGGAFALQFQGIDHKNNGNTKLYELGNNFNLATANLDLDTRLYDGVNLHLRTYLSSRHHRETYVKGGYITIDKLDFIKEGFLENVMQYTTLKIGHMENNYGDAHFRRSDNAMALYNPFVGNYLMDSFTTEVGAEAYFRKDGLIAMVGMTNGRLNQSPSKGTSPSALVKLGYDSQINPDLRVRLTGSLYHTGKAERIYLYAGDRTGSRYYNVMGELTPDPNNPNKMVYVDNFASGRINPDFNRKLTSVMVNPFIKYKGLEFFGVYENASGARVGEDKNRNYTQLAGELLYRFGKNEKLYVGGRYNTVSGELASGEDIDVNRFNIGGGWFMTPNMMVKAEYVDQKYKGYPEQSVYGGGEFNGVMLEAVIAF